MCRGIIGYKIPTFLSKKNFYSKINIEKQSDKLIGLVLKVAKEQGLCIPGNKVLIFYTENEGKKSESVNFKLIKMESEWLL